MNISKEYIQDRVNELALEQPWHHNIKLPHDVWTLPNIEETFATNITKWSRIEPMVDQLNLSGTRVLDVGCSDGYYSCEMSKKGVAEVIAIDLNGLRLKKAAFVKDALDINNIKLKKIGVENINEETLGYFDVVLCLGFLHRFPDPYGLLTKLATIADIIVLEWKMPRGADYGLPVMTFATGNIYGIDKFNVSYFYPTFQCVMAIMKRLGFDNHYPIDDGINKRVAMISTKKPIAKYDKNFIIRSKNIPRLLTRYTKNYIRTVIKIILGRIQA